MRVGILRVDLSIGEARSLKEKRKILKSTIARLRNKYNLSVAEVDYQDKWQRAALGIAGVANDQSYLDQVFDKAMRRIEEDGSAVIINSELHFC